MAASLEKDGFYVDHEYVNTIVHFNTMKGLEYDENLDQVFKLFSEEAVSRPLCMAMRKRDPAHYLSVADRVNFPHGRIKNGRDAIIFSQELFGVIGRVKSKDIRRNTAKIDIDLDGEKAKIHHPFIAENFLKREF